METKIEPYSPKWEKLANQLARSRVEIRSCKQCGFPHIKGYCCGMNDKCPNPHNPEGE